MTCPQAQHQVLSTLDSDGKRRWIRPRLSTGAFYRYRRIVAYTLILVFMACPFIKINGKPLILLDVVHREFTILGYTFLPTDTVLLALFMVCAIVTIFLATALFGRVWCGWACPQTIYMEFVYRPIERYFDRTTTKGATIRSASKYLLYFLVSLTLAHVFLAYFVGAANLFTWLQRSPLEHPTSFIVMAITTGLMMFDFCYFREQTCILACPYGRLQSVLLDRFSLVISYDRKRGEPRGKLQRRKRAGDGLPERGDCVNCGLCVMTCPTGIDIREGLQMECIGCAQCIDACDRVMLKIGKPSGLIRYSSQAAIEQESHRLVRPRVIFYPVILAILTAAFIITLSNKGTADITLMRNFGNPYTILNETQVANGIRVKIANRGTMDQVYHFEAIVDESQGILLRADPLAVSAGDSQVSTMQVIVPRSIFDSGRFDLRLRVSDTSGFSEELSYQLLGPI